MSRYKNLPFDRLAFEDWPEELQNAWNKACNRAGLSKCVEARLGKALELLFGLSGPDRPELTDIEGLCAVVEGVFTHSTVITYLYDIYRGLALLWPDDEWNWLQDQIAAKRKLLWAENPQWKIGKREKSSAPPPQRRALNVAAWPEEPRHLWLSRKSKTAPAGRTKKKKAEAPLAELSDAYIMRIERGLGHWFHWAQDTGGEPTPTPETINTWISDEQAHGSSTVTVASYAFEIWRGMSLIWPGLDWSWLSDIANDLADNAQPIRPQLSHQVSTSKLRALGHTLMKAGFMKGPTEQNIIRFRDGLIICLLTEKPMRLRNLAALNISDLAFDDTGGVTLSVGRTKNRRKDYAYLSPDLAEAIGFWINDLRTRLSPGEDCSAIWIGRFGESITAKHLSRAISKRTKAAFGQSISPHKFRNAVAMTLAHHAPDNIAVASRLLGHRDGCSIAPYEGLARTSGAADLLDNILADYTMPPPIRHRHK